MPPARTIAIGDIHGCLAALDAVLAVVRPTAADTLVLLGDYIDRGPDCRATLERLLELQGQWRMIPLLGNHDEMMLSVRDGRRDLLDDWLGFGGEATLASYGAARVEDIPEAHVAFLRACRLYHETSRHFFVHGNYQADLSLESQPAQTLLWESLKYRVPSAHVSGKTAIVGHTSQKTGKVLDLGHLKCIDTWCYGEGWLTALDVDSGRFWQADKSGSPNPECFPGTLPA